MSLIDNLQKFNRKERYHLLVNALGSGTFQLSEEFRNELGCKIDCNIPADAFVAMDYHLDWISVAVELVRLGHDSIPQELPNNTEELFSANQRDIDLLVAFKDEQNGSITHLLLVEAKATTGWDDEQLKEKTTRLKEIFQQPTPLISPHFVLTSPKPPHGIESETWPKWMTDAEGQPHWVQMKLPSLLQITRGKSNSEQLFFREIRLTNSVE